MKNKKIRNIILITLGVVIGIPLLTAGTYVSYVLLSYKRIGDQELEINSYSDLTIKTNKELTVTSYNIGFGAYSPNYTFFLDTGYNSDGKETQGTYGKGISYEDVLKNTNGSISISYELNSDFYLFQEVDEKADRSYKINQKEMLETTFNENKYDSGYCVNFDSAYLFYPFNDPHGKSKAGLLTFSKYILESGMRKEYKISDGFSKFFDLDRCFAVYRAKVEGDKELVLINSHMSAYDEGGLIRNKQIQELNDYILKEYEDGNYVVVGGDFNHDLLTNNPLYAEYDSDNFAYKDMITQLKPDWLSYMFDENKESLFDSNFTIYAANNEPSCRDCDVIWTRGETFVSTVDGFICSNNIEVKNVETLKVGDDGFLYSDHQPTTLTFLLK